MFVDVFSPYISLYVGVGPIVLHSIAALYWNEECYMVILHMQNMEETWRAMGHL